MGGVSVKVSKEFQVKIYLIFRFADIKRYHNSVLNTMIGVMITQN